MSLSFLFSLSLSATVTTGTCYLSSSGIPNVSLGVLDPSGVAHATFTDSLNETGFHHITITTNPSYPSQSQLLCAGFVDGYLTQHRVYERFLLYKDINNISRSADFPPSWRSWLALNMEYMRREVAANPSDSFWRDIGFVLAQFDGLVLGYQSAAPGLEQLREVDLLVIQSVGDIYDLEAIWDVPRERGETYGMECSGLVRLAPDLSDVYFAHDSWSDFRKMTNFIKEYHFNVAERKAKVVVVSTKMGALPSSEDFWMTDRGLLFLETTNGNYNNTLYERLTPESLLTWVRTLHAAWTTDSGGSWATEFLRLNSGTYNNQYVIVDAKVFVPGVRPTRDFVWSSFLSNSSHGNNAGNSPESGRHGCLRGARILGVVQLPVVYGDF
jgi:hypothetical protein